MPDKQNRFTNIIAELKENLRLNIDYAKLTAAEKLSILLTVVTFALLGFVLVSFMVLFLSMAIVNCIAEGTGLVWGYLIVCGFYLLLLLIILLFRKKLIVNPISRFVSRLFFNP